MTGVSIEDLIKQGEAFNGKIHNGRDWKLHVISSLWAAVYYGIDDSRCWQNGVQ